MTEEEKRNLGKAIKKLRNQKHLCQSQFAEHAGIGVTTMERIETGRGNMTLDTFQLIADALDTTMSDILSSIGC